MQRVITRKSEVREVADALCRHYVTNNHSQFWYVLNNGLLAHKVKFPLLEFVAGCLFDCIPFAEQLSIVQRLVGKSEDGSSVIAGKLLQLRLPHHLPEAFSHAVELIIAGNTWYHCDHVGERVFGYGLLTQFEAAFPLLPGYLHHENAWIRRAVGVAVHYATKKGSPASHVEQLCDLLLTQAGTRDYQVQRGVGWGLKTIAKFHPNIIRRRLATLPNEASISRPIMSKIEVGLTTADKRKG